MSADGMLEVAFVTWGNVATLEFMWEIRHPDEA
jgi:hypothetical protein